MYMTVSPVAGTANLRSEDMESLFAPVVQKVISLVESQAAAVKKKGELLDVGRLVTLPSAFH